MEKTTKLTKEDLKGQDAFQSTFEIVSDFFFHHRLTIIAAIIVFLFIGIIWAFVGVYSSNVEEKAQIALYSAESKLDATVADFEKSKATFTPPSPNGPDGKPKSKAVRDAELAKTASDMASAAKAPKATGNLETDYKDSLLLLQNVIKDYPKSQAAVIAALDLSKLYQDHGNFDAQTSLLENASRVANHPVTKGFTLNQLGLAYEGKGDCGKAIETWQKIEDDKQLLFLAGRSLVNMGLCYEKLHQNDKAAQAYLKAEGLVKDGDTAKTAKKYLRLLKRDQKS